MNNRYNYLFYGLFFGLFTLALQGMEEQQKNKVQLILLNGASCAGKTSLARTLVAKAQEKGMKNVEHLSFDNVLVDIVNDFDYMDNQLHYFKEKGIKIFSDPRGSGIDQYFGVFYQQILEKMHEGKLIVVDHCFSTKESFLDFLVAFKVFHTNSILIKVFCDYEVAKQRFNKRNEGDDVTQHRQDWCFDQHYKEPKKSIIYDNKWYHAELDTSAITAEESAEQLMHFFDESFHQDEASNIVRKNYQEHKSAIDYRYNGDCIIS